MLVRVRCAGDVTTLGGTRSKGGGDSPARENSGGALGARLALNHARAGLTRDGVLSASPARGRIKTAFRPLTAGVHCPGTYALCRKKPGPLPVS